VDQPDRRRKGRRSASLTDLRHHESDEQAGSGSDEDALQLFDVAQPGIDPGEFDIDLCKVRALVFEPFIDPVQPRFDPLEPLINLAEPFVDPLESSKRDRPGTS
jgi:hypothetical protein